MELLGYGYGAKLRPVEGVAPTASLNRVEYRRRAFTEWYINGPAGLEQGFTLNTPPSRPSGQPLTIALSLQGNFLAPVADGTGSLNLRNPSGSDWLRYTGLTARDATGKTLHAWLEIEGKRLLLRVEDRGGVYPLVIDPFVQAGKLTSSDGAANSFFGWGCAISGNTVVVTSLNVSSFHGAAYVFQKPATGWANMIETAELTSSDGAAGDYFGVAVGISGSTVIVGAYTATVGSNSGQGAAYVFVKPPGGWTSMTETAKLTAADGVAEDGFGNSVAISGNTAVIGAYATIGGNTAQGAVYLYARPASGWRTTSSFEAKLTASDGAPNDLLGNSVAIGNTTIVAGAPQYQPSTGPGAAYVFVKPASGWVTATQTAKLTAFHGKANDYLGAVVGISGSTVVATAYNATVGSHASQGAAYVFVEPTGGWTNAIQTAKLTSRDGMANDNFGVGLALAGSSVFVGAPSAPIGSNAQQGAVYEYVRPAVGWRTTSRFNAKFTASDGTAGTQFGASAAISGNTFVIGADGETIGTNAAQGAAYVFVP